MLFQFRTLGIKIKQKSASRCALKEVHDDGVKRKKDRKTEFVYASNAQSFNTRCFHKQIVRPITLHKMTLD